MPSEPENKIDRVKEYVQCLPNRIVHLKRQNPAQILGTSDTYINPDGSDFMPATQPKCSVQNPLPQDALHHEEGSTNVMVVQL